MRNIIVFGNVPLATWAVKKILESNSFNLLGVVCDKYSHDAFKNHGMNESSLYYFSKKNNIRILSFEEAFEIVKANDVLGISIRYHKLFKNEYYNAFNPGIINLHGGILPRYRGANIANYAVFENAEQGGGTLHFISEGIDEGAVVERVLFEVNEKLTAFEYFSKTLLALQEAFISFISRADVIEDNSVIESIQQSAYISNGEEVGLYYKKGIEKERIKDFRDLKDWDELYRLARTYTFPGHKGFFVKNGDEMIEIKAVKSGTKNK